MIIFVPKEIEPGETRAACTPDNVLRLTKLDARVEVESGLGLNSSITDDSYRAAGACVTADRGGALAEADIVLRVRKPRVDEVAVMKPGALHIGFLEPFESGDLLDAFMARGVDAIAMETIPRTTLAQKMDALSSQANLAGYVAVLVAASRLDRVLPMMMTPAGTLRPARVFVIGAGVAGLQAIATARRLGARVEAFDTRPGLEEQINSLGAKFVKIDLGEIGQTAEGYARELTDAQKELQKAGMAKAVAQSDIVITTAQVFGRKAPLILTREMVAAMRPGGVVVDLAAETGGNVEGVRVGEETEINGVRVLGAMNYAGRVPNHASQMYGANLVNLVTHFWDMENKIIRLDVHDDILKRCLIVRNGTLGDAELDQQKRA